MVRSSIFHRQHIKRTNISQISQQNIQLNRKPRKQFNKNINVQQTRLKENKIKSLNFYQSIEQVPQYKLTTKNMQQDPIKLINQLQQKYYEYGAVKLIVSDSWNCPFTFRYIDKEITTRIQCLQKLKQGQPFEQKIKAYRIEAYEAMAYEFQNKYKNRTNPKGVILEFSIKPIMYLSILAQYNIIVQSKPVTIQYAADLSSSIYGSGFPTSRISSWKDSDFQYQSNYFNLNNISKSASSLLSITQRRKQKISGISYPWLYMGMKFSTFCWHVEDMFVNSLNYNHKGSTKTWYIVPAGEKQKFDKFVDHKFKGNNKKKNILEKIILMIDPKELVKAGIKVYKVNQRPREYVCTFFKTYHAGFSHGFNVGQAVNFISARSLKYIDEAEKYYLWLQKNYDFKPKALVLSKDWLIHQNIQQKMINKLSKDDQIYIKLQYNKMLQRQKQYIRQQLITKNKLQYVNIKKQIHILPQSYKYQKLSCQHCKNYIYLFAIQCKNCGILCENHIQLCECISNINNSKKSGKNNKNMFQIWIRQPNKDRIKQTYQEHQIFMKVIQDYQQNQKKKLIKSQKQNKNSSLSLNKLNKNHHESKQVKRSKTLGKVIKINKRN